MPKNEIRDLVEQLKIEEQKTIKTAKKSKKAPSKPKSKPEPEPESKLPVADSKKKEKPKPKPKLKVEVVAKLPESPVKDYTNPVLHKVATKLVVDEPIFTPEYLPGCSYVSLRANLSNRGAIRLPFRGIETVDCGFELELPSGYRAVLTQNRLLAAKGLFLTGPRILDGKQRIQVTVINCGHQIIEIHNGDLIAEMSVEPVYLFDFQ